MDEIREIVEQIADIATTAAKKAVAITTGTVIGRNPDGTVNVDDGSGGCSQLATLSGSPSRCGGQVVLDLETDVSSQFTVCPTSFVIPRSLKPEIPDARPPDPQEPPSDEEDFDEPNGDGEPPQLEYEIPAQVFHIMGTEFPVADWGDRLSDPVVEFATFFGNPFFRAEVSCTPTDIEGIPQPHEFKITRGFMYFDLADVIVPDGYEIVTRELTLHTISYTSQGDKELRLYHTVNITGPVWAWNAETEEWDPAPFEGDLININLTPYASLRILDFDVDNPIIVSLPAGLIEPPAPWRMAALIELDADSVEPPPGTEAYLEVCDIDSAVLRIVIAPV